MPMIRRFMDAFLQRLNDLIPITRVPFMLRFINFYQQWIREISTFVTTGRNRLEVQLKVAYYLSLIQSATHVYESFIVVLLFEAKTVAKILILTGESTFMDFYTGYLVLLYDCLLGLSAAHLIVERRYSVVNFYAVLVLLVLTLGQFFEYGWYFSTGEWIRDPKFCFICKDGYYFLSAVLAVQIYQVYQSVMIIYNVATAYFRLKEHQQILDTLPSFTFLSDATKGG